MKTTITIGEHLGVRFQLGTARLTATTTKHLYTVSITALTPENRAVELHWGTAAIEPVDWNVYPRFGQKKILTDNSDRIHRTYREALHFLNLFNYIEK